MEIRRFKESDAGAVSRLTRRTLRISNSKDYPPKIIEALYERTTPGWVTDLSRRTHFYVVEEDGDVIGCGAVGKDAERDGVCALLNVFVLPEHQGRGVGRLIVETLEADDICCGAEKIEVASSITGLGLYRKLGYEFRNGAEELDEELLYRLEKRR